MNKCEKNVGVRVDPGSNSATEIEICTCGGGELEYGRKKGVLRTYCAVRLVLPPDMREKGIRPRQKLIPGEREERGDP